MRTDLALTLCATGHLRYNDSRRPVRIAEEQHFRIHPGGLTIQQLRVIGGNLADQYMVELGNFEDHADGVGWVLCTARLMVNGVSLGYKPLSFYAGAATDWATGLVAWTEDGQYNPSRGNWVSPGPVWQLGVRTQRVSPDGK